MYAYAPAGTVQRTGSLPSSWKMKNGTTVSGFDQLTPAQQKAEDWYPVVEQFATLGANQHHGPPVYAVRTDDVLAAYPAVADSAETVNQKSIVTNLQQDMVKMDATIAATNATINANPAAYIKDIARMNKRLGRQALGDYTGDT
jgi:hypothetical protein